MSGIDKRVDSVLKLMTLEEKVGQLQFNKTLLKANEPLKVRVTVTNSGTYAGEEVVQLYSRDMVGSVVRPVKELKGFQKIFLQAGESKTISFVITTNDLRFYNNELKFDWEAGEFETMIGGNSKDVKSAKVNWVK